MTFVLLCLIEYLALTNGQNLRDPSYTLNFDSPIYVCPDEDSQEFVDTSGVEMKRHNETTAIMTGKVKFLKGFQQETMVQIIIEKDLDGTLEMVASHEICDVCHEMGDPESMYNEYLAYFGFPGVCPFEPDYYPIHDFVANTEKLPINSATAGRYQVTMNIYKNPEKNCENEKTFLACLKLDFLVEPL